MTRGSTADNTSVSCQQAMKAIMYLHTAAGRQCSWHSRRMSTDDYAGVGPEELRAPGRHGAG